MSAKSDPSFVSLLAHPNAAVERVRRVAAWAELPGPDSLRFHYVLEADPGHISVPSPVADAGRTDKLWAHTCFEAFVGLAHSPRYLELNFSPSGEWAAYCFTSYREGMVPAALHAAPRLTVRREDARLELQAEVHLGGTLRIAESAAATAAPAAGRHQHQRLRLALSTVVEDREGRLSYWALRHPPGRPDFHHPESFSLALELPANP